MAAPAYGPNALRSNAFQPYEETNHFRPVSPFEEETTPTNATSQVTSPSHNSGHPTMSSWEKLPPGIETIIAKEIDNRVAQLRLTSAGWSFKPWYHKAWSILNPLILLATFATTIWLGTEQRRSNDAAFIAARAAQDSTIIANQSLAISTQSEKTANESLILAQQNNNISAIDANNTASGTMLQFIQYCEDHPISNMTFTNSSGIYNCSDILSTPLALPSPAPQETSSIAHETNLSGLSAGSKAGIGIGVALGILALIGLGVFCIRTSRMRAEKESNQMN